MLEHCQLAPEHVVLWAHTEQPVYSAPRACDGVAEDKTVARGRRKEAAEHREGRRLPCPVVAEHTRDVR